MKGIKQKNFGTEFYLFIFLAAALVMMGIFSYNFFSLNNIMSILNRFSYVLIAAIGMNIIIITGNIDVSAGALISVICIALAALGKLGLPFPVLLIAAMVLGAFLSFINAIFVTKFRIPAIVATLATSQLFSGVLPLMIEGSIYDLPESFTWFSFQAKLFGFIPGSIVLMLILTIMSMLFMKYSRFSKKVYATGNNANSAYLMGINTNKIVMQCYILAGIMFGISATIIATASQRVTTTMGSGLEMIFIAAVVLGGTSVSGGSGKLIGTVLGALILSLIAPAANYLGISPDWSDAITGTVIIVAVIVGAISGVSKVRSKKQKEAAAA